VKPISIDEIRPERIDAFRWRLPKVGPMRTDGLVYASQELFDAIRRDQALVQVCNVATLPGIVGPSIAMPDIHWGYGFPIGGVAAFDLEEGVVSPGGVGFDISCGVRLLRSGLRAADFESGPRRDALANALFDRVPSGVGRGAKRKLSQGELTDVMKQGARWAVEQGLGTAADLDHLEEGGCLGGADPGTVSVRAIERGREQLGTLGAGNHFLEVQRVDEVFDATAAQAFGLQQGALTVSIHTGSRGFGYQICEDSLRTMVAASARYGIDLPDRQLCCAPLGSPEGKQYLAAMACGANYAMANRQVITARVREAFESMGVAPEQHKISVVYDVCHNIAKLETHEVEGVRRRVCVHRKGATRALPAGHPDVPAVYRAIGQPVLVPGDMGRYSFVLCGSATGAGETFASSCHGAGRLLSRTKAKQAARGRKIEREMLERGVLVRSESRGAVAEEIPEAYKDVANVVESVEGAGIASIVARLVPLAVVKG
jgi:tRNA-splicing ligase RtcB